VTVTSDAVTFEVGEQRDHGARALLGLLELGDVLDHRVRALAEELVDEGHVARGLPRVHRPDGLLFGRQGGKIGQCHFDASLQN
jgi:hypothetical protein